MLRPPLPTNSAEEAVLLCHKTLKPAPERGLLMLALVPQNRIKPFIYAGRSHFNTVVLARISHQFSTAAGGSGHVYCVALGRAPRHTVVFACGALRRSPCIHARLRRLATKTGEKCGLGPAQK